MRVLVLLCLALLLPAALAYPVSRDAQGFVGVAHTGSRDRWTDWFDERPVCGAGLTWHRVTLTLLDARPGDLVVLRLEGAPLPAYATQGVPATLVAQSRSTCAAWSVEGVLAEGVTYRVETATAAPVP